MKRAKKFRFSVKRQNPAGGMYDFDLIITVKDGRISKIYESDWSNAGYVYIAAHQPDLFEKHVPVLERGLLDVYELAYDLDLSKVRAVLT